jgi:hypothetical protein
MWLPFVFRKRPLQINYNVINNLLSFDRRLSHQELADLFVATTKHSALVMGVAKVLWITGATDHLH